LARPRHLRRVLLRRHRPGDRRALPGVDHARHPLLRGPGAEPGEVMMRGARTATLRLAAAGATVLTSEGAASSEGIVPTAACGPCSRDDRLRDAGGLQVAQRGVHGVCAAEPGKLAQSILEDTFGPRASPPARSALPGAREVR